MTVNAYVNLLGRSPLRMGQLVLSLYALKSTPTDVPVTTAV